MLVREPHDRVERRPRSPPGSTAIRLVDAAHSRSRARSNGTGLGNSRRSAAVKRSLSSGRSEIARETASTSAAPRSATVSSATQGTRSSRRFQTRPSAPPGTSTRAISASAAGPSNQWNAWPTKRASALASGSGIRSAVPAIARTDGSARRSSVRMFASGSTAVTSAPAATSTSVSLPVPAARSTARGPGAAASTHSTAAAG